MLALVVARVPKSKSNTYIRFTSAASSTLIRNADSTRIAPDAHRDISAADKDSSLTARFDNQPRRLHGHVGISGRMTAGRVAEHRRDNTSPVVVDAHPTSVCS